MFHMWTKRYFYVFVTSLKLIVQLGVFSPVMVRLRLYTVDFSDIYYSKLHRIYLPKYP